MTKILLLSRSKSMLNSLSERLQFENFATTETDSLPSATEMCRSEHYDAAIVDGEMELEEMGLPVIVISRKPNIDSAITAMRHGAIDYISTPIDMNRLLGTLRNIDVESAEEATPRQRPTRHTTKRTNYATQHIIGHSDAIEHVRNMIRRVAPSDARVLVLGENGTGKELVARWLHMKSMRAEAPFVEVNCAAIPAELIESELFGHERGAFTGAVERKKGRFERAEGGTIFLDEIGEIPLQVQVKLLRVLESRTYERVGGTELLKTDARVVAATNRDLKKMVEEGSFREDLYYRLNVVSLELPPLRARKDDIPLLVAHYLEQFSKENGREMGISPEAMEALTAYRWPGNIRELRNCVERMVVLNREKMIGIDSVPLEIREQMTPGITQATVLPVTCDLERNEKMLIIKALNECDGNRTRAAEKLGISRRTLLRKMKTFSIE